MLQTLDPAEEILPAPQTGHELTPDTIENVPAEQFKHEEIEDPPSAVLNVPAEQFKHNVDAFVNE